MAKFKFTDTGIKGLVVIEPTVFGDSRGFFMETYNEREFLEAGLPVKYVQDNQSRSIRGVLRGLHFQVNYPQAKIVRVISGEVYDVAVDLRENSETRGNWRGMYLSADNKKMLFVPRGFAHGFLVISETAEFIYKCDEFYHPEDESGILWNDPDLNISWPKLDGARYIVSDKDKALKNFRQI